MLFPVGAGKFENRLRLPSGSNGVVVSSCVPLHFGAVTLRVCMATTASVVDLSERR